MHVIVALLKLLLDLLLQKVDPQLQAEVLLLQVVQVLRDGATADSGVRHADGWWRGRWWGHRTPEVTAASRLEAGDEEEAAEMKICSVLLSTNSELVRFTDAAKHDGSREGVGGSIFTTRKSCQESGVCVSLCVCILRTQIVNKVLNPAHL